MNILIERTKDLCFIRLSTNESRTIILIINRLQQEKQPRKNINEEPRATTATMCVTHGEATKVESRNKDKEETSNQTKRMMRLN